MILGIQNGDVVTGQGLRYNLTDSTGEMNEVEYFLVEIGSRGEASRLIARDRNTARVEGATYTNCEVGNDDWYLRAKTIDLDRTRDLGVARDASVVFKGVPILYSPYLDFSLSGSRKSGFLPPAIGQTAQSGTEMTLPYYFNLAPNYDATLTPRYIADPVATLYVAARGAARRRASLSGRKPERGCPCAIYG